MSCFIKYKEHNDIMTYLDTFSRFELMEGFAKTGENLKDSRKKTSSRVLNEAVKKRSELENMQTKHMSWPR